MCGFIMLGCPNSNKKKVYFYYSYYRLNALFEKTNDPEDFLSFAKIQFKVQQDGCTVSKTLIGRVLTKLGFEVISGFKPWSGESCIQARGELDVLCIGGHVSSALETPDNVTSADSSGVHET